MNQEQKEATRRNYMNLVENLTDPRSTGIADHLFQDGVIEERDRQIVDKKDATKDAIKHLLDAVRNSSHPRAFDCFLRCLEEYGQDYLANSLRESVSSDGTGLCELCPDDKKSPAASVCINCNQLMCSTCVGSHKKSRFAKEHKFRDLGTALTSKCPHHPSFHLKSYCSKCDYLICEQCMVDTHKDHAETWKDATTAAEEIRNQLKELVDKMKNMSLNQSAIAEEIRKRLADLENNKQTAVQSIEKRQQELHKLVDDAAAKAKVDLDKKYLDAKVGLQTASQITTIEKHLKAYENLVKDASMSSLFQHHAEWGTSLREMLSTHSSVYPVSNLRFTTITWAEKAISQAMGVVVAGEITPTLVSQFQLQCSKNPEEWSNFVDSMPDGHIVVGTWCTADKTKQRIIICSYTGNIKQEIQVTGLMGLTVLRDGTIAATAWDSSTQEVRIYTKDGEVKSAFKCNTPGRVTVNHEGHLVVIDEAAGNADKVMIYRTDGEQIRVFTDISTKPVKFSKYVSTTPSCDIIVSDPNDRCIRVYTPEGQLRYTYGGEGVMKDSHGACADEDGNIFITDLHADNIHQVSPSGQYIRHVLTDKDGLWGPRDVCINQQGHLVVAQQDGWIKTYRYK